MIPPRDRTCLHCGKLFTVTLQETRGQRRNFCSVGCEGRFRSQFDTCFVEGCPRQHLARGLCAVHARVSIASGGSGLGGLRSQPAASRLNPLVKYGLARREGVGGYTSAPPDRGSPPQGGADGRWQRFVRQYRQFNRRFGVDAIGDGTKLAEPLSTGVDPQTEIDQTRFIRSPLM